MSGSFRIARTRIEKLGCDASWLSKRINPSPHAIQSDSKRAKSSGARMPRYDRIAAMGEQPIRAGLTKRRDQVARIRLDLGRYNFRRVANDVTLPSLSNPDHIGRTPHILERADRGCCRFVRSVARGFRPTYFLRVYN